MYGHHIWQTMDRPGKVASPARGQLNRKNAHFPVPVRALRIWFRETGSAILSRFSLLILRTQAESDAYSRDYFRFPWRLQFIYLNRHTPSGQFRVCRVTQLRTDGVHCRVSTGTGPVNLKVVLNGCYLGRSPWTYQYAPLFPPPTFGMKRACWKYQRVSPVRRKAGRLVP